LKDPVTFGNALEYPLVVFYSADSTIKWANYYLTTGFDASATKISDIKFDGTAYVAFVMSGSNL
jgi:hypothetical protein